MSSIKVGQFSDLHYAANTLVEADRCFGFAVEHAISSGIEVAVISGDSTDHALDAHSPAFLALAKRIQQLANHCPVLVLQGTFSHEAPGMIRLFELLGAKYSIAIADKIGQIGLTNDLAWQFLENDSDVSGMKALFTVFPTINKADLIKSSGHENVNEALGNHLHNLIMQYSLNNELARKADIPTIFVSHGTVDGCMTEHGVPMHGSDHEFSLGAIYQASCSAGMIGHIHKHQHWETDQSGYKQIVAYPGSIGRNHYGELGEKHYLLWDIGSHDVSFEPVVTPSCKMIDLTFDGPPDLDQIASVAADVANAFVRVRYCIDEEHKASVDRDAIKKILSLAAEVRIEGVILPVQRQRAAGISVLPSLSEQIQKWGEVTGTDTGELIPRISELESLPALDIAEGIKKRILS
ncbi:metallophosphatase family protein [Polynucleobacter sp. JS-Safj-400b-B2]|uniref:metallophosphoesterase family protein n=1 Tax=Polynucleobacter sp. JS-Safj-400b-B2 TaxID=2576921 RepID=UPI001C0C5C0B|nr:metallophosphatase family protein [Polynucleobacter sp. JS-Safj-400b-B2]MBU3625851.1 metallophosphatase family protein [Polynucleobacter sp. JS-Safj-400b-B2]